MKRKSKIFLTGRIFSTLLFIVIIFFGCSNEEEKLELFSAEAFTYSMASGWELNASCRVKGFVQNLKEDKFFAKLSYSIDLKTPEGKVFEKIDEGFIDQSNSEKVSDFDISTQLQLNSDYKPGKYKIIFNVTDSLSNQSVQIEKEFEL